MRACVTLATGALAAELAAAQIVQWDIARRDLQPAEALQKRAGQTYTEVITNERQRGGYFATAAMGTPLQNLTLQLDTGSSDVWVPYSGATVCTTSTSRSNGCSFGAFNYKQSSSFKVTSSGGFKISYVDGSKSQGDYFSDKFEIGGATLNNLTMGLGLVTDIPYGLVGVGYAANEAVLSGSSSTRGAYDNLPVLLAKQGLIPTTAYSLWLNDLDSSTGTIMFGGIDTEKYDGTLTRINVQKNARTGNFTSFVVYLTSLSASSGSGSDDLSSRRFPIPVVLDSGTTYSYLPNDLAVQVWNEVGAGYSNDFGVAVLPCLMAASKGTFEFGFAGANGPKIRVAMDELVLPLTTGGTPPKFTAGTYKGQDVCTFGIQNFTSDPFLLGDTFLRSAYVVYDLVNNQIGLAATKFNATKSNVVAFESSGAQIPSATVANTQVTASAATGSLTSPSYAASSGFSVKSAAPGVPALDRALFGVVISTMLFMAVGSGMLFL